MSDAESRGNRTAAVIFLLRDYIADKGERYTNLVSYIAALKPDEETLREVYTGRKEDIDAKLSEAKGYLAALEGH